MKTAVNDHIAQFVKGAHVMSAAAVFVLLAAAIPASVSVSTATVALVQTKVVGTVEVSSIDMDSLRHDIATLKQEVDKLNSKLSEMQKTTPPDSPKKTKPFSRLRSGNQ